MQIIPVLDLKNGLVVRAVKGEREAYRPIMSPLSKSSEPADIIDGYLRLYPFRSIYIADIDAIEGRGENRAVIAALMQAFPKLEFWVDDGVRSETDLLERSPLHADAVIGSETLSSVNDLRRFSHDPRVLLSLDFRNESFLGPQDLLAHPEVWPKRVIVMTLARVGADLGPDIEAITNIKARAGGREIFAAGGVRDVLDLQALAKIGVSGVLMASALHNGTISASDIREFSKK